MNRRTLVSIGLLTLAVAVILSATVAGQAPAASPKAGAAAKAYTPPKTPDGQPDLQGFWTNSTYVPLERPNNVTKEFYTPEEALAAEKRAAEREATQTEPGTTADVHYDFTQFGLDRSQATISRNLRTSLVIDPPDGRIPPVNATGQKRAAEVAAARKTRGGQYDSVHNMPIGSRCIIMGGAGPPMMNAGYNANYQIVQGPGYVMILTEMIHDARIIPLDGRPAPPAGARQWTGISRGRWEGNTLVVDTTNFSEKANFRGSAEGLHLVERFTRTSATTIDYRFTVDDPATWTKPWTVALPLVKNDGEIYEYACHEGNRGLENILSQARTAERSAPTK